MRTLASLPLSVMAHTSAWVRRAVPALTINSRAPYPGRPFSVEAHLSAWRYLIPKRSENLPPSPDFLRIPVKERVFTV